MPKRKVCLAFTLEEHGKVHQMVPCGKPAYKQRLCSEHYREGKELAYYRSRFEAVNVQRRRKRFLQRQFGLSGRQWVRLRKLKQRQAAALRREAEATQAAEPMVEASYGD